MDNRLLIAMLFLAALALCAAGCTDAQRSNIASLGNEHAVVLYSGGVAVASWVSTGAVASVGQSDGYRFRDKKTGRLVEVSGDVTITTIK